MHAKLLLLRRKAPFFDRASGFVNGVGALEEPRGKLQIIRMVFISQAKGWQSPGVFHVWIKRKGIVFDRQGSAVTENLHRPRKVVCEDGFEVLAPAGSFRRNSSERKRNRGEIVAGVETATAVKAYFFMIEFVEIMKHTADTVALVVVERM